jgi:hypothetical protein
MFLFRATQEYPSLDQNRDYSNTEPGLIRHRKDKKRTTPSENQAFRAAL